MARPGGDRPGGRREPASRARPAHSPRSALPDPGPADSYDAASDGLDRLASVAEGALGTRTSARLEELLTADGEWVSARRLLADLVSIDLRPESPYRLRWSDGLTAGPGAEPAWLSHGVLERTDREA
nr:hypothetical protein GCM10020093_036970 [Planobispora longispora]